MSCNSHSLVLLFAIVASACPADPYGPAESPTTNTPAPSQLDGTAGTPAAGTKAAAPSAGSGGRTTAGAGSAGRTGSQADDDAGVSDDACPPNIAVPAICQVCADGTCGVPTCSNGALTGKYRCPAAPTKPDATTCQQTGKPVCGNDGKPYDAAGGDSCVPVPIACQGSCPCRAAGAGDCVAGGCSNQLCTDAASGPVVSTCEWREEYACYRSATCERQTSGQCSWTPTPELTQCLQGSGGP